MTVAVGQCARRVFEVLELDTAESIGSGDVPVLGTPRLLAWAEAVTVAAARIEASGGQTSVGTRVELDHLRPSAVGARVTIEAWLSAVDGPRLVFLVEGRHPDGSVIARGQITRVVVQRERFLGAAPDRVGLAP